MPSGSGSTTITAACARRWARRSTTRRKPGSPRRHAPSDNLCATREEGETMTTFPDLPTFVTHLECAMTGEKLRADVPHNLSPAGFPILVRYDLTGVRRALTK